MTDSDQPPGIDPYDPSDVPAAHDAARRVREFLESFGDGQIMDDPPLYARDLAALVLHAEPGPMTCTRPCPGMKGVPHRYQYGHCITFDPEVVEPRPKTQEEKVAFRKEWDRRVDEGRKRHG